MSMRVSLSSAPFLPFPLLIIFRIYVPTPDLPPCPSSRDWRICEPSLLAFILISLPFLIDATTPQGHVFQAVEANSGRTVALKKSRVSQRVKRTILRYESRILQLLQGHPAIPAIYGYGHLPHFEYLAMELLGPSIKDCTTGPVAVTTASRTVLQMVCAALRPHSPFLIYAHC
jgi:hypothetical protein